MTDREGDVQALLLVRAFEEADTEGHLLPLHDRLRAGEQARAGDGGEAWLIRRARLLLEELTRRLPWLGRLTRGARLGAGLVPLVLCAALLAGLCTNALGPERQVNVLALPLLAIMVWNLAVYVGLAWMALRDGSERRAPGRGPSRLAGLAEFVLRRSWRSPGAEHAAVAGQALERFASSWREAAGPLAAARLRRLFHGGAALLAVGALAGMYVRGLGLQYSATWESTFLGADTVQSLLGIVLGPATALLGTEVPDVSLLEAPASGDAAVWIHLYALTAVITVVVPRGLLAMLETRRCARLAAGMSVDLGAGYYRRLLAPAAGEATLVTVTPYSHHLEPRDADALMGLLHEAFGARAAVVIERRVDYGAEDVPSPPTVADDGSCVRVLLFGLGQSPESEVHARFVLDRKAALGEGHRMVVLVDGSAFRERLGGGGRQRERQAAWNRVVRESGLEPVHVDLRRPAAGDDDPVAAMGRALWPASEAR